MDFPFSWKVKIFMDDITYEVHYADQDGYPAIEYFDKYDWATSFAEKMAKYSTRVSIHVNIKLKDII